MDQIERGKAFLAHYSSQYYDPAKAHEYYEKTKELKGGSPAIPKNETKAQREARRVTAQNQREALSYTRKQIGDARTADSKSAQAANKARMEKLRTKAEDSRKRIEEKLNARLADIKAKAFKDVKMVKVKLKPLNPIPPNASPQLLKYLEKQNAAITKSNNEAQQRAAADYSSKRGNAQKAVSDASAAAQKAAGDEMKKIGTDLKAAVTKARADYAAGRKASSAKFKSAMDTEEKNIKANVK